MWPCRCRLAQCPLSSVLYDACPKSLRSGVWWPQTKFGILASVPCPRGALGEYLGAGAVLGGGLSLACCGSLFLRPAAWFLHRWEAGKVQAGPSPPPRGSVSLPPPH